MTGITEKDVTFAQEHIAHDIDCAVWCIDGGRISSRHPCDCGAFDAEQIVEAMYHEMEALRESIRCARAELLRVRNTPTCTRSCQEGRCDADV